MEDVKRVRDLIKPQRVDQNDLNGNAGSPDGSLAVPYCASGYSTSGGTSTCASGYSQNYWCISKPSEENEVLF